MPAPGPPARGPEAPPYPPPPSGARRVGRPPRHRAAGPARRRPAPGERPRGLAPGRGPRRFRRRPLRPAPIPGRGVARAILRVGLRRRGRRQKCPGNTRNVVCHRLALSGLRRLRRRAGRLGTRLAGFRRLAHLAGLGLAVSDGILALPGLPRPSRLLMGTRPAGPGRILGSLRPCLVPIPGGNLAAQATGAVPLPAHARLNRPDGRQNRVQRCESGHLHGILLWPREWQTPCQKQSGRGSMPLTRFSKRTWQKSIRPSHPLCPSDDRRQTGRIFR